MRDKPCRLGQGRIVRTASCPRNGEEHHREPVVRQVVRFATLSNGRHIEPLNCFKRPETALRKAQQAMSRKTKFSNNWKKAKARIQRIHSRSGNTRRDFLHKTTTTISQNHAMVCIEDLQVRNMSKSG